jgi:hypothetical protein
MQFSLAEQQKKKPKAPTQNIKDLNTLRPNRSGDHQPPRDHSLRVSTLEDAANIICLLHAQTLGSRYAVQATMLHGPQHVLQNEDLEGIEEDDLLLPQFQETRDLALRMSSTVKSPRDGFIFGRNPNQCDVLLTINTTKKHVSNKHFTIYVNSHGSLILQDLSTNGTLVDGDMLRARGKDRMRKPSTHALNNGSIISIISDPNNTEIRFLVRIPSRQGQDDLYEQSMRRYLEARSIVP